MAGEDNVVRMPVRDAERDPLGFMRERVETLEKEGADIANALMITLDATSGSVVLSSSTRDRERQLSLLSICQQSIVSLIGQDMKAGLTWEEYVEEEEDDDTE